jgi:hypothetical protein
MRMESAKKGVKSWEMEHKSSREKRQQRAERKEAELRVLG